MFEDIVICEMYHSDPLGNEYCNPEQISIGMTNDNSIMVTLTFGDRGLRKVANANNDIPLEISVETLDNTKIEIKDKYDVQEAVKVSITDSIEIYDMLIGSNGLNFPHFTNIPAINNTTDFGNAIFLNFPHAVEGFSFKGSPKKFE
jgi:hypothetical protein